MINLKKELVLFTLLLFFLPLITPLEIKLSKDSYAPRETLQAEITGNFISLKSENILIYKDNKVHSEPVINGLTNQNRVYYFYALLPNQEGNYTLKIENSEYIQSGDYKSDTIMKNFTIIKTNESTISIDPGFIFTNKDFSLKLKALDRNQEVPLSFENQSSTINLYEESEETIYFSIVGIPTKFSLLKIGKYSIPVFIVSNITNITNSSSGMISQLEFSMDNINAIVFPNRSYFFTFYLENNGQTNITNITITNNLNGTFNPSRIDDLKTQEKKQINLTIFIQGNQKKNISGIIRVKYDNDSISVPIFFEITENKSKVTLPGFNSTGILSCRNIGKICLDDEECKGQLTPSLEAPCCIGECSKKSTSSSNWIYGIIILIIVVTVVAFILFKYKQKQNLRPKSIDEMVREKVDLKKMNQARASKIHDE